MVQVEFVIDFLKGMGCKVPVLLYSDIQTKYEEYLKTKLAASTKKPATTKNNFATIFRARGDYTAVDNADPEAKLPDPIPYLEREEQQHYFKQLMKLRKKYQLLQTTSEIEELTHFCTMQDRIAKSKNKHPMLQAFTFYKSNMPAHQQ